MQILRRDLVYSDFAGVVCQRQAPGEHFRDLDQVPEPAIE
jgi:hypothetical protein